MGEITFGADQLRVQRIIFGAFSGEKAVGKTILFCGALDRQSISEALAAIRAVAVANRYQVGVGSSFNLGIEMAERHAKFARSSALRRIWSRIKLAEQLEKLVFRVRRSKKFGGHLNGDSLYVHA
ncbi:MAG: hypothetical protein AAFY06_06990 [Pseudomonadota bacterium]